MNNKTFCKMPFIGFQASYRGFRLCCASDMSDIKTAKDFWDSDYREQVKKKMLDGQSVSACRNCYKSEALGQISMRNHYNSIYKDLAIEETPTALDLDFSNLCNLKCIMCGPDRSSQWAKELGKNGSAPVSKKELDQLCKISHNVKHLTIQGGEPSIMPEFEYYFDYLKENNLIQNIDLDCISNLTNINNKFYKLLEDFKSVNINASVDSYHLANDYIRFPSKFKIIEQNLDSLANRKIQVNLQITVQVLSMFNFYDFLVWCKKMQTKYMSRDSILGLNISYVKNPRFLDIQYAPNRLKQKMISDIKHFRSTEKIKDTKFNIELRNIEKVLTKTNDKHYADELRNYLDGLDKRRNIKVTNYIPDIYEYI